jgi:Uma2 family endonuclease
MPRVRKIPHLTVEQYLAQEERAQVRHEYVNGQVFAMTGATEAHNAICVNLLTFLHQKVKGSGCRVFINDMKVHVETANSFYYPDIMVTCEPFVGDSVFKQSPKLIVEVLSPSTSRTDRREKLVAYRQLISLQQYLIVHQKRNCIEVYQKNQQAQWEVMVLGKSDTVSFDCLESRPEISVEAVYEGVSIPPMVKEDEEDFEYSFAE